jgi:hypothetical protein
VCINDLLSTRTSENSQALEKQRIGSQVEPDLKHMEQSGFRKHEEPRLDLQSS